MKLGSRFLGLLAIAAFAASVTHASAQALYTATQALNLSGWGGITGTSVNLSSTSASGGGGATPVFHANSISSLFSGSGGKNVGISAGVDLRVWQFHGFLPTVEVRGTYPVSSGDVAGEENVLGGIKIERIFGRYHPYGDFLFGRDEMKYQGRGYVSPDGRYLYLQSFSNVLSPGFGVDIDINHHYAAKVDVQFWRQSVPVTTSGSLTSLALTIGAIYRFDFNHYPKAQLNKPPAKAPAPRPANAAPPATSATPADATPAAPADSTQPAVPAPTDSAAPATPAPPTSPTTPASPAPQTNTPQ